MNLINVDSVQDSSVKILIGDDFLFPLTAGENQNTNLTLKELPLQAKLKTLPALQSDGKIHLNGLDDLVTFFSAESAGDIKEYRLDKNIYFDSNGDGVLDNDVDNQSDASLKTGENWTTAFSKNWGKTIAQLTVVDQSNQTSSVQVEVVFDENNLQIKTELKAELFSLPEVSATDQKIHLIGDSGMVTVLGKHSTGEIVEYRIDRNIYFDSDQNGKPNDDIDNLDHPSLYTGENFTTAYKKDW